MLIVLNQFDPTQSDMFISLSYFFYLFIYSLIYFGIRKISFNEFEHLKYNLGCMVT